MQQYCLELFVRKKIGCLQTAGSYIWVRNGFFAEEKKEHAIHGNIVDKNVGTAINALLSKTIDKEIETVVHELQELLMRKKLDAEKYPQKQQNKEEFE